MVANAISHNFRKTYFHIHGDGNALLPPITCRSVPDNAITPKKPDRQCRQPSTAPASPTILPASLPSPNAYSAILSSVAWFVRQQVHHITQSAFEGQFGNEEPRVRSQAHLPTTSMLLTLFAAARQPQHEAFQPPYADRQVELEDVAAKEEMVVVAASRDGTSEESSERG